MRRFGGVISGLLALGVSASAAGGEPTPDELRFFETDVRPVLAANCFKCHGPEKQSGGLRLDGLATILAGGDTGPAVVPGRPEESLLIEAINRLSFEMPPSGKLKDADIAVLTRWVKLGAPWPGTPADVPLKTAAEPKITDEDRAHWAFQPVRDPAPPAIARNPVSSETPGFWPHRQETVRNQKPGFRKNRVSLSLWIRNDIDRFVLHRLLEAGLTPAPEADRRTLIRRVYFDLLGV
ncbi:MAG: c-type cytochrome domain-containing protein, partial [Planctomycetaceae bacterium]